MTKNIQDQFSLKNKTIVITGGAGLLGEMHCEAILEAGGNPVILDIFADRISASVDRLSKKYSREVLGVHCDITSKESVENSLSTVIAKFGKVDGLVNNAANDPKVRKDEDSQRLNRFENLSLEFWENDISVGLTGAFLCCQVFGTHMAENSSGVILNFASDLAVIAPDQRIYRKEGKAEEDQPVKPVTYSVVKTAMLGLTRYLCTYWADNNIRVNSMSPGGVFNGQNESFLREVNYRIPMGRMASRDEYKSAIVFLLSDASSYMTGANMIVDGGRSVW